MPHYADGTEAKLGDLVVGKPYNTPHEVTGVVVGLIRDSESCNVRVAFAADPATNTVAPDRIYQIKGYDSDPSMICAVGLVVDYGETKAFRKLKPQPADYGQTPRVAFPGDDLIGKVCICSIGRVGLVVRRGEIKFPDMDKPRTFWQGIGFDGKGLWATGTDKPVCIVFETVADFIDQVLKRPNNLMFGSVAFPFPNPRS